MTGRPDSVWVLVISHRHGVGVSAHPSHASAYAAVHAWVKEWWERECPDAPLPESVDDAVSAYFEAVDNEDYVIEKCDVEAVIITVITPVDVGHDGPSKEQ